MRDPRSALEECAEFVLSSELANPHVIISIACGVDRKSVIETHRQPLGRDYGFSPHLCEGVNGEDRIIVRVAEVRCDFDDLVRSDCREAAFARENLLRNGLTDHGWEPPPRREASNARP